MCVVIAVSFPLGHVGRAGFAVDEPDRSRYLQISTCDVRFGWAARLRRRQGYSSAEWPPWLLGRALHGVAPLSPRTRLGTRGRLRWIHTCESRRCVKTRTKQQLSDLKTSGTTRSVPHDRHLGGTDQPGPRDRSSCGPEAVDNPDPPLTLADRLWQCGNGTDRPVLLERSMSAGPLVRPRATGPYRSQVGQSSNAQQICGEVMTTATTTYVIAVGNQKGAWARRRPP